LKKKRHKAPTLYIKRYKKGEADVEAPPREGPTHSRKKKEGREFSGGREMFLTRNVLESPPCSRCRRKRGYMLLLGFRV
jgi:hypothetical protein